MRASVQAIYSVALIVTTGLTSLTSWATPVGKGTPRSRCLLTGVPTDPPPATLPLPAKEAEKRALAEKLVARFDTLDDAQRDQLEALVPYAFEPLLARCTAGLKGGDSVVLQDTVYLLFAICRAQDKQHTAAILAARSALAARESTNWRDEVLNPLLQQKGDPAVYAPVLVRELRALPPAERQASEVLSAVARSFHPEAVALMLEALRDPTAAPAWRREAFLHLAGTGGAEGVRAVHAVRAARFRRAARPPWYERIDLTHLSTRDIVDTRTDAKGRTWVLFHNMALGSDGDLFVVQKLDGGKWGRPVFTGVRTPTAFHKDTPTAFRGVPIDQLLAGEWIRLFPDDEIIREDTDGDGLTDRVEERLGTDPRKADTDGDGLKDAVDPCPTAAPPRSPVGDAEQIVAACVEARFFGPDERGNPDPLPVPALLSVYPAAGVKPFELYGWPGTLFWEVPVGDAPGKKSALHRLWPGGLILILLSRPESVGGSVGGADQTAARGAARPAGNAFVEYGPDRRTARTVIGCGWDPLGGDGYEASLKKIGDDWFVVDLKLVSVS